MRTLILVHSNVVNQTSKVYFYIFYIEISCDTIKYLKCVVDQLVLIKSYDAVLNLWFFFALSWMKVSIFASL